MRRKIGTVCMGLGAALVLAALSLFLFNQRENETAHSAAEKILPQVMEQIEAKTVLEPIPAAPAYPAPCAPAMTEVEVDGCGYIGCLSIPALDLELPVMGQWDYDRLKLAPCRYAGSTKTGDLVICAHNYESSFGSIQSLAPGEAVYFTDLDGTIWQYEAAAMEILQPTDIEAMTAGEYDLTLFTCTYGGQSRVAVRCDQK